MYRRVKASNVPSRANKLTFILIGWRRYQPLLLTAIPHLSTGVSALKARQVKGEPYSQDTLRDYITTLKRFYLWVIENEVSAVPADRVKKIWLPAWDSMTKTASQPLTEEDIACTKGK